MSWKQPIPTNLIEETCGDAFGANLLANLILYAANTPQDVYIGDELIHLERGQCIFGRFSWAKKFGLKKNEQLRVYRRLVRLQKVNNLVNNRKHLDCTVVTIKKYDEYTEMNKLMNNRRTIDEQSMNTHKSVKSVKKKILPYKKRFTKFGSSEEAVEEVIDL